MNIIWEFKTLAPTEASVLNSQGSIYQFIMHKPLVSVVIPCFNHGVYLKDALASLDACDKNLFELIIVNDGSTDTCTNQYLRDLSEQGYKVLFQENTGLGQARNNGIKMSVGKYILPLDSDNKIRPGYLTKSLEILEQQQDVAVVYGNAAYFGDQTGILKPGPFNLQRLMLGNYIDACAVIRKSVLEEVGYYDKMPVMGVEDWDLWLRIAFKGHRFFYIDEVLFDYRVQANSMIRNLTADNKRLNEIEDYLTAKYADKLSFEAVKNHFCISDEEAPFQVFICAYIGKVFPCPV